MQLLRFDKVFKADVARSVSDHGAIQTTQPELSIGRSIVKLLAGLDKNRERERVSGSVDRPDSLDECVALVQPESAGKRILSEQVTKRLLSQQEQSKKRRRKGEERRERSGREARRGERSGLEESKSGVGAEQRQTEAERGGRQSKAKPNHGPVVSGK